MQAQLRTVQLHQAWENQVALALILVDSHIGQDNALYQTRIVQRVAKHFDLKHAQTGQATDTE